MQFLYYPNISSVIEVDNELYKYLFKVRRLKNSDIVNIRNLEDDYLYKYRITQINKKSAILELVESINFPNKPKKYLHIGWCIIEPKIIEKNIHMLNEIGVSKVSFIYCDFSQKNFKINLDRINKILINSNQQSGRSNLMELEILNSLDQFKEKYNEFVALDFNKNSEISTDIERVVVGCEGGFSERERELFNKIVSLDGFILKSETAVTAISSKILL